MQSRAPDDRRESDFRDFAAAPAHVREFYRENHRGQTLDFVLGRKEAFLPLRRERMGVWRAIERLSEIVDQSDPDIDLSQLDHSLQTAESLRAALAPPWLVLAGFVHDLGKVLCLFGEPQWAVVGDTFPVGCAFAPDVVHADLFAANPDAADPRLATAAGIYAPGCGLDRLHFSWGHDEYLYHVLRPYLSAPALDVIRYHSFYAGHREGAYAHLLADGDAERLHAVAAFSRHDLYSKRERRPDFAGLRPYYEALVAEFLPDELAW
jgi:inositol oxygenase